MKTFKLLKHIKRGKEGRGKNLKYVKTPSHLYIGQSAAKLHNKNNRC